MRVSVYANQETFTVSTAEEDSSVLIGSVDPAGIPPSAVAIAIQAMLKQKGLPEQGWTINLEPAPSK